MAWCNRSGHTYYYQSYREGGRVKTRYFGAGAAASIAAAWLADEAKAREAERRKWRTQRERLLDHEREADAAFERVERTFRETMAALGYWRPKRTWRKRRMRTIDTEPRPVLTNTEAREIAHRLLQNEEVSDGETDKFRAHLEHDEPGRQFREIVGDVEAWAWSKAMKKYDRATRIAQETFIAAKRRDLYGASPTDLERLLADRAVFCWHILYRLENWALEEGGHSSHVADFIDRRIDRASRRYLASIRALAVVRKLAPGGSVTLSQTVKMTVNPGEPIQPPALSFDSLKG